MRPEDHTGRSGANCHIIEWRALPTTQDSWESTDSSLPSSKGTQGSGTSHPPCCDVAMAGAIGIKAEAGPVPQKCMHGVQAQEASEANITGRHLSLCSADPPPPSLHHIPRNIRRMSLPGFEDGQGHVDKKPAAGLATKCKELLRRTFKFKPFHVSTSSSKKQDSAGAAAATVVASSSSSSQEQASRATEGAAGEAAAAVAGSSSSKKQAPTAPEALIVAGNRKRKEALVPAAAAAAAAMAADGSSSSSRTGSRHAHAALEQVVSMEKEPQLPIRALNKTIQPLPPCTEGRPMDLQAVHDVQQPLPMPHGPSSVTVPISAAGRRQSETMTMLTQRRSTQSIEDSLPHRDSPSSSVTFCLPSEERNSFLVSNTGRVLTAAMGCAPPDYSSQEGKVLRKQGSSGLESKELIRVMGMYPSGHRELGDAPKHFRGSATGSATPLVSADAMPSAINTGRGGTGEVESGVEAHSPALSHPTSGPLRSALKKPSDRSVSLPPSRQLSKQDNQLNSQPGSTAATPTLCHQQPHAFSVPVPAASSSPYVRQESLHLLNSGIQYQAAKVPTLLPQPVAALNTLGGFGASNRLSLLNSGIQYPRNPPRAHYSFNVLHPNQMLSNGTQYQSPVSHSTLSSGYTPSPPFLSRPGSHSSFGRASPAATVAAAAAAAVAAVAAEAPAPARLRASHAAPTRSASAALFGSAHESSQSNMRALLLTGDSERPSWRQERAVLRAQGGGPEIEARDVSSPLRSQSSRQHSVSAEERPSSSRRHLATAEDRPSQSKHYPVSIGERPSSSKQYPVSVGERPSGSKQYPGSVGERPSSSKQYPVSERPSSSKQYPVSVGERPSSSTATQLLHRSRSRGHATFPCESHRGDFEVQEHYKVPAFERVTPEGKRWLPSDI